MSVLDSVLDKLDSAVYSVARRLKTNINDYCDLNTTVSCGEYDAVVADDGSLMTMLRFDGFRRVVGEAEYRDACNRIDAEFGIFLRSKGRSIQFVFLRDSDSIPEISRIMQPQYDTAKRLQLHGMIPMLDSTRDTYGSYCLSEDVTICLWSQPAVVTAEESKMYAKQREKEIEKNGSFPPILQAQNIFLASKPLREKHRSFVDSIVGTLNAVGAVVRIMDGHETVAKPKKFLYREYVPDNYKPQLLGDPLIIRWKKNRKNDVSCILPPRIGDQIMSMDAQVGNAKGQGGVTDTRAVRLGSRLFAPCQVVAPPQTPSAFSNLFSVLNNAPATDRDGSVKAMPWALSITLSGDGIGAMSIKGMISQFTTFAAKDNNGSINRALRALKQYAKTGGTVPEMQIAALTWAHDEDELSIRRGALIAALQKWGDCEIKEETGDPLQAVCSIAPGISSRSIAESSAPPLEDAVRMLPLMRPAPPLPGGQVLMRSNDGKILTHQQFSNEQTAWLTLVLAVMGSGKSVWLNRMNKEMCLMAGIQRLPYIGITDVGVSSLGFINAIRDSLPDNLKHQVVYRRIQKDERFCVNPLEPKLGMRTPLSDEIESMKSTIIALVSDDKGNTHRFMSAFVTRLLTLVFRKFSDETEEGQPRAYKHHANEDVRVAVEAHGIKYTESTKWWTIVDALFDAGDIVTAKIAMRYVPPTLQDLLALASSAEVLKEFDEAVSEGMNVCKYFSVMMSAAVVEYKYLSTFTAWDVGNARIMSLDLQDLAKAGGGSSSKNTGLAYAYARNIFMRKIQLAKEDLPHVPKKYANYYKRLYQELSEDMKRMVYDEYHFTSHCPEFRSLVQGDGRVGRKWNLEIVLASQLPTDFKGLEEIATTKIILKADSPQLINQIREIFGLSDTEASALGRYCQGPKPWGATYLAMVSTKDGVFSQLLTSSLSGIEYWTLASGAEDRSLKEALEKYNMSPAERLMMLARRFPIGGAKEHFLSIRESIGSNDDMLKEDQNSLVAESIAKEIHDEFISLRLAGSI